jgi:general secretion pathway protein D
MKISIQIKSLDDWSVKQMKSWKWLTIQIFLVITFFSCAGLPPAPAPVEPSEERPLPTTSLGEKPRDKFEKSDLKRPADDDAREPPGRTSEMPATAPPPAAKSPGLQSTPAQPSPARTAPRSARRLTHTDYRLQTLPTRKIKPAPGESALAEDDENYVALSFNNADINEVIASIAGLIGLKYIVDHDVQGTVTINSSGRLAKENLLSVLYLILEANGLTAVKDGAFYRITTVEGASRLPVVLRLQTEGQPRVRQEEIVTQVIPLQYISAAEMSQLLKPFLSAKASIIAHQGSNTLVVVDTGLNIMKALKLVEGFDIGLFDKTNHRFFFLEYADADDVVKILTEVFAPTLEARKDGVKFIPIKRMNSFLAISPDRRVFNKIQQLLLNLDAETKGIEPRIYVYFVKNGAALNLANLLKQVFADSLATEETKKPKSISPLPQKPPTSGQMLSRKPGETPGLQILKPPAPSPPAEPTPQETPPAEVTGEAAAESGSLRGPIKITPDEIRNALVIEAAPADYRVIRQVLKKIDVLPRQVLIEATIAEIDYTIVTDLGVEWEFLKGASFRSGLQSLIASGDSGLRFAVGITDELKVTLDALEQENRAQILSSPHVLASDNQEARIDISQEIPTVTADTVIPSGGSSITTTTVQYRDTGVLLAVTPHINERGLVTMDVYQEVSEQAEDVVVAGESYPSFFKRVVQTSLTVQHGQTIVLGGLIRENKSKSARGVPWLVRLPIIGFIFGSTRDAFDKTELIIMLTPIVIVDLDDVDAVTEGFKSKVDSVVRDLLIPITTIRRTFVQKIPIY